MAVVTGIDGCSSGWLSLTKDLASGNIVAQILPSITSLLRFDPKPEVVMVDVPIGLTDSGPRACDLQARIHLKAPRASSVFPAPIRPTLGATSYAADRFLWFADGDGSVIRRQFAFRTVLAPLTFPRAKYTFPHHVRPLHIFSP